MNATLLNFQTTTICHAMLAIVFLPAFNHHRRLDLKISVFRYRNSQINQKKFLIESFLENYQKIFSVLHVESLSDWMQHLS